MQCAGSVGTELGRAVYEGVESVRERTQSQSEEEKTMVGRAAGSLLLVITVLAMTALPAQAGGWATVTLDAPLSEVRAGEAVRVGFTVKQHGVTPIHSAFGTEDVRLTIRAWKTTPKDVVLEVVAVKDAANVGHFTADLTFPSPGVWEWEATPAPFAGSRLQSVTVVDGAAARVGAAAEAQLGATRAEARSDSEERSGMVVGLLGLGALVIAAGGMVLMLRRRT